MTKRKATKKPSAKPAAPPSVQPLWGPPIPMGTVAGKVVDVREPRNQAAIDSLSNEQCILLVMADSIRSLEQAVGQLQGAMRHVQRDVDVDRRLARLEAATAARPPDAPNES